MPFDFNSFLFLAAELAARTDPASQRSAISRAYYTAYHLASTRAETRVGPYKRRPSKYSKFSTHAWCWQQFIDTNDTSCRQIGLDGNRMKKRRHAADYQTADIPNLNLEAQRQITDALQFQGDIAALAPQYPQPQP